MIDRHTTLWSTLALLLSVCGCASPFKRAPTDEELLRAMAEADSDAPASESARDAEAKTKDDDPKTPSIPKITLENSTDDEFDESQLDELPIDAARRAEFRRLLLDIEDPRDKEQMFRFLRDNLKLQRIETDGAKTSETPIPPERESRRLPLKPAFDKTPPPARLANATRASLTDDAPRPPPQWSNPPTRSAAAAQPSATVQATAVQPNTVQPAAYATPPDGGVSLRIGDTTPGYAASAPPAGVAPVAAPPTLVPPPTLPAPTSPAPTLSARTFPAPATTSPIGTSPIGTSPASTTASPDPLDPSVKATASVTAPTVKDWRESLQNTIQLLEHEVYSTDRNQEATAKLLETKLHVLYAASEDRDKAVEPIYMHSPDMREFWRYLLYATTIQLQPDESRTPALQSADALRHLRDAERMLAKVSDLDVRNVTFCSDVQGFGQYVEFDRMKFEANEPVLLYFEVDNFVARAAKGGWETRLQGSYVIYDASAKSVANRQFPVTREVCRNYRRDFFMRYLLPIPAHLDPGRYTLQLTVKDELGDKFGQGVVDFEVRAATP